MFQLLRQKPAHMVQHFYSQFLKRKCFTLSGLLTVGQLILTRLLEGALMLKRHALEKAVATAFDLIDPATVVSP